MLVRQRLRAIVDSRKAQHVCWACLSRAESSPVATENLTTNGLTSKEYHSASSRPTSTRSYRKKELAKFGDISKNGGPTNGAHVSKASVKKETALPVRRLRKTGRPRQPPSIESIGYEEFYATKPSQIVFAEDFIAPTQQRQRPPHVSRRAHQSAPIPGQYSTYSRSGQRSRKIVQSFTVPAHGALLPPSTSSLPFQSLGRQKCTGQTYSDGSVQSRLRSTRRESTGIRAGPRNIARPYGPNSYNEADDSPLQEDWALHKQSQETSGTFDRLQKLLKSGQVELLHARSLLSSAKTRLSAHSFPKKKLDSLRQSPHRVQVRPFSGATEVQPSSVTDDGAQAASESQTPSENIRDHLIKWHKLHESQVKNEVIGHSSKSIDLSSRTPGHSAAVGIDFQDYLEITDDKLRDRELGQDLEPDNTITFDQPTEDFDQTNIMITEGDLVDYVQFAGTDSRFGVVVRRFGPDLFLLNDRGEWKHTKCSKVNYVIPRFLSARLSRRLKRFGPSNREMLSSKGQHLAALVKSMPPAPRDDTREIMLRIASFRKAADVVFQKGAANLNRALELIVDKGAGGPPNVSKDVRAIARRLLGKSRNAQLSHVDVFVANRTLGDSDLISFRNTYHYLKMELFFAPTSTVDTIRIVKGWTRQYQEALVSSNRSSNSIESIDASAMKGPFGTFVKKARRIILRNREVRPLSPVGAIGRASLDEGHLPSTREEFDKKEMRIVNFLRDWAWTYSEKVGKAAAFAGAGSMIIRAIGLYEGQLADRFLAWTVLKELNVIHPWEPLPSYYGSIEVPDLYSTNAMALSRDHAWGTVVNEDLEDSMSGLRKDWGDMAVFCIDSTGTLERDDGISLEAIAEEPENVWLHVHIANPTAFIDPESSIATYARGHGETFYFPHQRSPLLPPDLVRDRFSLGSNRPCITFSAKLSSDGDLLEHKITNGTVHNVYHISPEQADNLVDENANLGSQQSAPILQIGKIAEEVQPPISVRSPESDRSLGEEEIGTLRRISTFTKAHNAKRLESLSVDRNTIQPRTRFLASVTFPPQQAAQGAQGVSQDNCDPSIVIRPTKRLRVSMISQAVEESMLIAGQICASWCKERNIPIPYRGHVQNPQPLMSPEAFRKSYLEPFIKELSSSSQTEPEPAALLHLVHLQKTYAALLGSLSLGADPLKHLTVGIPVYCKATSPLRRYTDMLAHWQVEAVLRYENATKISLADTDPAFLPHMPNLPFSKQQIAKVSRDLHLLEIDTKQVKNGMMRLWVMQALHHAFYFDPAQLPKTFEAIIHRDSPGATTAHLKGWDVFALVKETATSRDDVGVLLKDDRWEVELQQVDVNNDRVVCVPVRLLWRETQTEQTVATSINAAAAAEASMESGAFGISDGSG